MTVGISSEDARRIQFSGSEHSYDGAEVERFRNRVIATLEAHEAALAVRADHPEEELAAAQRVRHQAVELAERMLRDVMGASGDDAGGLRTWQDAAMLRALAEEEMAFAGEESRRLIAMAQAERDALHARYSEERKALRSELQRELQASRDAAASEAEAIRAAASQEATSIVKRAVEHADEAHRSAADESHRMERRLAVLHTALADAESRFRRLASTAANDLGTLEAIMSEDVGGEPTPRPELHLASVDLTDAALRDAASDDDVITEPGMIDKNPEIGFYQRRLAGLRDRLEKSGHPPE